MITELPKQIFEVSFNNEKMWNYLLSLSQDVPSTARSWLYENKEPDWILDQWKHRLRTLENGTSFEVEVFQFDTSQEEKWGPQGGHAPVAELFDSIIAPTFEDVSPHPRIFGCSKKHQYDLNYYYCNDEWSKSIDAVIRDYRRNQVGFVRPASKQSVLDDMRARDVLESNSGFPDFQRRNDPEAKFNAMRAASNGQWRKYPAIALFRTYRGKTRLVWMFPMATNIVEGTFYQPLQRAITKKNLDFYAPWQGFNRVRTLITQAYDAGKVIMASDFSSTDAHFKLLTSAQAVLALEDLFRTSVNHRDGFWNSIVHMHTIPLIVSADQMVVGNHGVSSGSNWTNFIETVFDHIFASYVALKTDAQGLYAIGDDMAWVADTYDDAFQHKLETYGKEVGQIIKADKTTNYPDKVKTLQRLFQRGYRRPDGMLRGVYSTIRALNSSVFPERFHSPKLWSSDMFCARQFMILENCVDHPLFEEFVDFVCRGQKDLIPFAKKSRPELERIHRQSKSIPGLNPTYNQERRDSSLADFEAIAVASKL